MANGDEAPRADSFCAHAIAGESPFVVPDTAADPRFADNAMGLGFYAGTPVTAGGQRIGTLCVAGEGRTRPAPTISRPCACWRRRSARTSSSPGASANARRRPAILRRLGEATSRLARVSDADELEPDLCVAAQELAGADGAILWTAAPGGMLRATPRSAPTSSAPSCRPGTARPRGRPSTTASGSTARATSCSASPAGAPALFQPLLLARAARWAC